MFGFMKTIFIVLLSAWTIGRFGELLGFKFKEPIKCLSLSNQQWKARPTIFNINSDKTLFYLFNASISKSGGSYKTIDDL